MSMKPPGFKWQRQRTRHLLPISHSLIQRRPSRNTALIHYMDQLSIITITNYFKPSASNPPRRKVPSHTLPHNTTPSFFLLPATTPRTSNTQTTMRDYNRVMLIRKASARDVSRAGHKLPAYLRNTIQNPRQDYYVCPWNQSSFW